MTAPSARRRWPSRGCPSRVARSPADPPGWPAREERQFDLKLQRDAGKRRDPACFDDGGDDGDLPSDARRTISISDLEVTRGPFLWVTEPGEDRAWVRVARRRSEADIRTARETFIRWAIPVMMGALIGLDGIWLKEGRSAPAATAIAPVEIRDVVPEPPHAAAGC